MWLLSRKLNKAAKGQGSLACCDSWGCKESDRTERLNWTELNIHEILTLPPYPRNSNGTAVRKMWEAEYWTRQPPERLVTLHYILKEVRTVENFYKKFPHRWSTVSTQISVTCSKNVQWNSITFNFLDCSYHQCYISKIDYT